MENKKLTHGGDWAGFEIEYGKEPLDYSMNVNPLGIPVRVQEAIAAAAAHAERYPDPLCRELTQRLADHEDVPAEWIFCGNGAADIIFRLAGALKPEDGPGHLLVTAPTFSEYETAFGAGGWKIDRYMLREEKGFCLDEGILDQITGDTDAVFLCEPNNPTGITTKPQLLHKILEKCRQTGTVLVVDECFNGFLEDPRAHTMKGELAGSGLIVLKAFTKLWGMAGVRLGYSLCAEAEINDRLRQAGPPWNVSSLAQAAGIAALQAGDHVEAGLNIVHEERPWLRDQLKDLLGAAVYGEANYLLFRSRPDLDKALRAKGILIRNCSNYPGLGEGWFRIAVRTHEENLQLIEALKEELT